MRFAPFNVPLDLDTESTILKYIANFSPQDRQTPTDVGGKDYLNMLVATFNANVPYSGFQVQFKSLHLT